MKLRISTAAPAALLSALLALPALAQVAPGGGVQLPGTAPGTAPGAAPPTAAPPAAAPDAATARQTIRRWFDGFEFVPRAEHFARLGPAAAPALIALADDTTEHPVVRARALSSMVYLDDPTSAAALARLLESPDAPSLLRRKAALVLAEREGPAAIDRLATALVNAPDDLPLREACARGLRTIGAPAIATRDALLRVETAPTVRGLLGADKRIGLE